MEKLHEYSTSVNWTEGSKGRLASTGIPSLAVGAPPDFGGEGGVWSPEHMFVASTEVCVMLTFLAIARMSKLEFVSWRSSAKGKVERVEGQGFMFTGIEIDAEIGLKQASDREKAEKVLEKTDKNCLVTKSMKTPVDFRYKINAEGD